MKLHPRHQAVARARLDIAAAVTKAVAQYDLSWGELWHILAELSASWAKGCIREERNDKDTEP